MRSSQNTTIAALGLGALLCGCLPAVNESPSPSTTQEPAPSAEPERRTDDTTTSREAPQVAPLMPGAQASTYLEAGDASQLLDRLAQEGSPEVAARMHSCTKFRVDALGRALSSRGIPMGTLPITLTSTCPAAAGNVALRAQNAAYLYCNTRVTLGLPQYGARLAESPVQTAASATKYHDLFLAAAADLLQINPVNGTAANPTGALNTPACTENGKALALFEADGRCNRDGFMCLTGAPPSPELLVLCDQLSQTAAQTDANAGAGTGMISAQLTGRRLAVAAMLAQAFMCE